MMYTVKQARNLCGLTQNSIAEKMGISRATYIRIERNPEKATVAQGMKIAEITGIPFNSIFFGTGSTKSRESA